MCAHPQGTWDDKLAAVFSVLGGGKNVLNTDQLVWLVQKTNLDLMSFAGFLDQIMDAFDANGDGQISAEEFRVGCETIPAVFMSLERSLAMVVHTEVVNLCTVLADKYPDLTAASMYRAWENSCLIDPVPAFVNRE